jgi:hypothetical protein
LIFACKHGSPDFRIQWALGVDALQSTHPIAQTVTNPAEIGQLYHSLSSRENAENIS